MLEALDAFEFSLSPIRELVVASSVGVFVRRVDYTNVRMSSPECFKTHVKLLNRLIGLIVFGNVIDKEHELI